MAITRKTYGRDLKPLGAQERTFVCRLDLASNAIPIVPLLCSHQDLYIYKAYLINDAAISAHDTNYRSFALHDRGSAGTGTTAVNTPRNTKVTGGTAIVAQVPWDLLATEGYLLLAGYTLAIATEGGGTDPAVAGVVVIVCK